MAAKRNAESQPDDMNDPKKMNINTDQAGSKELPNMEGENSELHILKREMGEMKDEIASITKKIGEICLSHGSVITSLQFHSDYLESLSGRLTDLSLDGKIRDTRIDRSEQKAQQQNNKLITISRDVQDIAKDAKSKNIVINGLLEKKGESATKTAVKFLKNISPNVSPNDIETSYRVGPPNENRRPLLVKFINFL